MRSSWAGLLMFAASASVTQAMDVDVNFFDEGGASARIRIYNYPAKEPLGAIRVRLKLKPEAAAGAVASMQPTEGPWAQFLPQVKKTGDNLMVWAMAPNMGASKDSSAKLIADLFLTLGGDKPITLAAGLIDSVIVEEAWTPFGKRTTLQQKLSTALRPVRADAQMAPVERVHGLSRTLNFSLGQSKRVRIYVSDFRGRRRAEILDRKLSAGMHEITWDGKATGGAPLPAGTYFLRLEAGTYTYDRKLEVSK